MSLILITYARKPEILCFKFYSSLHKWDNKIEDTMVFAKQASILSLYAENWSEIRYKKLLRFWFTISHWKYSYVRMTHILKLILNSYNTIYKILTFTQIRINKDVIRSWVSFDLYKKLLTNKCNVGVMKKLERKVTNLRNMLSNVLQTFSC